MIRFARAIGLLIALTISLQISAKTEAPAKVEVLSLETITKNFEAQRKKMEEDELRRRKVMSALYDINRKIRSAVSEKARLQSEREALDDNIRRLNARIADLDSQSFRLKTRLAERLRAIWRLGGPSLARMLFSVSSSSEMDRHLRILGAIAARDRDLIREYGGVKKDVATQREKLAKRSDKLKKIEDNIKDRERRLVVEQGLKHRLLEGLRRQSTFAQQSLKELREKSMQYDIRDDAVFDLLFKPSFAEQQGNLTLPVAGEILRGFGPVRPAEGSWALAHKGVFIKAARGLPVQSVFGGTVAFTGELPGFGRTVIVDHGDHYYTVYSNAGDFHVENGDEVKPAQVIATTGDSAFEGESGLYFEIRHFSEPYDPQQWMKGTHQ